MTPAAASGLTTDEAAQRLRQEGPNRLPEPKPTRLWLRIVRQFKSPLIYILLAAMIFDLSIWLSEGAHSAPVDAIAIFAILLMNAALGAVQEYRSEQALSKLKDLTAPKVWARRDGRFTRISSREIVPGDIVRVNAGERVPADGRLLSGEGVMVDEAMLTGESLPVDKARDDELFSGTLIVRSHCLLQIERTGPSSAMGRLATLLDSLVTEPTPLERRLRQLGNQIAVGIGLLALAMSIAGIAAEGWNHSIEIILFAIALAVAAVPEGLPAVVTLALSRGVQRMARRHAVVRRLSAVEALGSVTVIATDKTGTLTENALQVRHIEALDEPELLRAMILANDADPDSGAGNPVDRVLLEYAGSQGLDGVALRQTHRLVSSQPFDSRWKFSRVTVATTQANRSYLKGAPEVVLARTRLDTASRQHWTARATLAAEGGYRVLALAAGDGECDTALDLLGLVLLWDPPRAEVPEAIRQARQAGVRVVMITGDHPGTAQAIARHIGMAETSVMTGAELDDIDDPTLQRAITHTNIFARVSPEHKVRLVQALKAAGEQVAVTGDGVNDAPALKSAHVGVAMGQRGSDVAREVADLVLLDDNFATIVGAIEEGRNIYTNIQNFIRLFLSADVSLVLLVIFGAVIAYALDFRDSQGLLMLPLTAVQLLWINLIADGLPALALTMDRNPGVMTHPPRPPDAPLLDRASLRFVIGSGAVKAIAGGVLLVGLPLTGHGQTMSRAAVFLFESLVQVIFAYPARALDQRPLRNNALHLVILATVALQFATLSVPSLRQALGLELLTAELFALVITSVAITWVLATALSPWARRIKPR